MYVRTLQSGMTGYRGLGDTTSAQSQIVLAANKYGVDPGLALAVAQQESGYQQTGKSGATLTSSAGAIGVMQLMPATAAGLNVDPNDQSQNIDGGVRLLSQLLKQFNGNVSYALAGYNAGAGNVQKYGGIPPFPETQNYVASILANYQGAASINPSSDSGDTFTSSDGSGSFDFSSYLPSSDSSYDIGGMVLSGGELLALGGVAVGVLVLSAIL
jgi:hypothetical protein